MLSARKSKKRDAIYEALCSTETHPTAEWIYTELKQSIPNLSLGTVYRNLTRFKEEGKAVCVATVNGQERYDADTAQHGHFICQNCGAVEDLADMPPVEFPQVDGEIRTYQLNFYGTCSKCKRTAG